MARTKQNPEFEIEVDGAPYVWRIQRRPQWSSDTASWRGMALAVRHQEGQREARAIASAIAADWDPLSRGKTVSIVVDATGG